MDTEEKILAAAKEIFIQKGYAAARMQEIADKAGINKGLLHYYFKNKNKLFSAIFMEAFHQFAPRINKIFESDLPLFEKIESFVDEYMDVLLQNPNIPLFVIHEMNQKPEEFISNIMSSKDRPNPMKLIVQIQSEVQKGRIREINPLQLVMNMISMCVFPLVASPLFKNLLQMDQSTYSQFMQLRKKEVSSFIIESIKIKNE
jgi:TetR/AcrR family transcriptional regulator